MAVRGFSFAAAVLLGALITLSRVPLQPAMGGEGPFIIALAGMMITAAIGGFWATIVVTAVGFFVAAWVLATAGQPPMTFGVGLIFGIFGLVFATAGGLRKRGIARARLYAERLAETQGQLQRIARLNAMGELAGSLAHELNQPLTAVANYVNAAKELLARGAPPARVVELLEKASLQTVRAGQIVSRVRASVDRGEIEATPQSLSAMIHEAVDIALAAAVSDAPSVRYDLDRNADLVLADRLQVQQVVLNLVRNALEAMDAAPRRELRIACRAGAPGFVETCVADTGPGIAPEIAERLFQPFVSGKSAGMGVGLSISRGIVEAHGGRMWAGPGEGGGAAFHFSLQRAEAGA